MNVSFSFEVSAISTISNYFYVHDKFEQRAIITFSLAKLIFNLRKYLGQHDISSREQLTQLSCQILSIFRNILRLPIAFSSTVLQSLNKNKSVNTNQFYHGKIGNYVLETKKNTKEFTGICCALVPISSNKSIC